MPNELPMVGRTIFSFRKDSFLLHEADVGFFRTLQGLGASCGNRAYFVIWGLFPSWTWTEIAVSEGLGDSGEISWDFSEISREFEVI